jgi:hypothetical protein
VLADQLDDVGRLLNAKFLVTLNRHGDTPVSVACPWGNRRTITWVSTMSEISGTT